MAQIERQPLNTSGSSQIRQPLEVRDMNSVREKPLPSPIAADARSDSLKPVVRLQNAPASPVSINPPYLVQEPSSAQLGAASPPGSSSHSRTTSREHAFGEAAAVQSFSNMSLYDRPASTEPQPPPRASSRHSIRSTTSSHKHLNDVPENEIPHAGAPLQYHHQPYNESPARKARTSIARPNSSATMSPDPRGRVKEYGDSLAPTGSPRGQRGSPAGRHSPDNRPMSYIDLLNEVPYHQQKAPVPALDNSRLQLAVGANASLLDTKKTLDMYRANVKKTNDPTIQYEFAIFMVNAARDAIATGHPIGSGDTAPIDLIKDAKELLQKLSDRGYPFAQYYLADGYASGFFNKDKVDHDKAFPLFVAASKHGHAEASYRAALCYEFGWGTAKSYPKAAQFHRNAASKGHPGAAVRLGLACLRGDMGLGIRSKEGVKWLKRASEGADVQYNSGPYELGLLHIEGHGDDIFKDEAYAAQLFTQSAELGHPEANYRMGQAYEHGLLGCPKDPALSVHFYNGAATVGVAPAMLALCAWYMVGAEPVLEKDEFEAYEWAKRAAHLGFDKAEYALAYFTEMGIGCRRDPLEANMWYVRAAEKGNETAKQRLAVIRAAAEGETLPHHPAGMPMERGAAKSRELSGGKDKDCIVM